MALQMSDTLMNAMLDAIDNSSRTSCALEIRSGGVPSACSSASTGTVLATIALPADWLADAASHAKAISGTWQDTSADAAGTAAHFRVYSSQATKDGTTCIMQGTVGQGSGDLSVDNTLFAQGQSFSITAFTITANNA
jgi:hypothetical protein